MDPFLHTGLCISDSLKSVRKSVLIYDTIIMDGQKDILGVWIGEHESSKFWLNVLNDLKSRGVLDVYLFCTDGLDRKSVV